MKSSSTFVQGLCAGALLTLFMLLFAAGSARSEAPLQAAEPQTISIVIYATSTPAPIVRLFAPPAVVLAASPEATSAMTHTVTVPVRERVSEIPINEQRAYFDTLVLTTTLDKYFLPGEICPIQQYACLYSYLVGNLDAGIAYPASGQNISGQGRLMHPAMLKPLASLRNAVFQRWTDKYALVMLKAYDPASNLSAQGQTAEVTLLPSPTAQELAQLCGMAFRAGFDWVGNEGGHCRVAIKAVPLCVTCRQILAAPTATPELILLVTPVPPVVPTATPINSMPIQAPRIDHGQGPTLNVTPIP